ncbi:hypothetical protein Acsp02_00670 [Actinoplanes sp. NBRC 103695]|nr:hypothetical protein Acsp02_00670 [Actinoplanes sp. NBRC 103695]
MDAGSSCPVLPRGERALAGGRDTATNRYVVATRNAVYHQGFRWEFEPWRRLGWDRVERADWDAGRAELTLVGLEGPHLTLRWPGNRGLLDLARERIAATTLLRVPVCRAGQTVGWLSARRPAGSGDVRWVLRAAGVELTDEELARAIRQARVQSGI